MQWWLEIHSRTVPPPCGKLGTLNAFAILLVQKHRKSHKKAILQILHCVVIFHYSTINVLATFTFFFFSFFFIYSRCKDNSSRHTRMISNHTNLIRVRVEIQNPTLVAVKPFKDRSQWSEKIHRNILLKDHTWTRHHNFVCHCDTVIKPFMERGEGHRCLVEENVEVEAFWVFFLNKNKEKNKIKSMPTKYIALGTHRCWCHWPITVLNERAGSLWFLVSSFGIMSTWHVNKLMHGTVDVKEGLWPMAGNHV